MKLLKGIARLLFWFIIWPVPDSAIDQDIDIIYSEFRTKEEFIDTMERMDRHAKKARIAWEAAEHGAGTPISIW